MSGDFPGWAPVPSPQVTGGLRPPVRHPGPQSHRTETEVGQEPRNERPNEARSQVGGTAAQPPKVTLETLPL